MRFYSALVVPGTTGRRMVANAARFPVPCGITGLQQADSVVEGHALN